MGVKYNHKEVISKLRKEREDARDKMYAMTLEIESMLNKLAIDGGEKLIKWDDFKDIKIGVPFFVNKDIYFVKYLNKNNVQGFKAFLNKGAIFGTQLHDCKEEIFIIEGNMIDDLKNDKIHVKGDTVYFKEYEPHKPRCTVDSIYKSTFTKDN